jgi:hypothetical protein
MKFKDLKFGEVFGLDGGLFHKVNTDAHPELLTTFGGIDALGFGDGKLYIVNPEQDVQEFPFGEFDSHDPLVSDLPILGTGSTVKVDTSRFNLLEGYNEGNRRERMWKFDRRSGVVYRNEGIDHQGIPQYRHLANQIANVSQQHVIKFINGNKKDYRRENLNVVGVHYHGVVDFPRNKTNPFKAYNPTTSQGLGYYRDRDVAALAYDLFIVGTNARAPLNFPNRLDEYELAINNRGDDTIPADNYTDILKKIEKFLP